MGLLLSCLMLVPAPENHPLAPPLLSVKGAARAVGLAKGCVLACFVRSGMTEEQVRRILGEDYFVAASSGAIHESYYHYGLSVWYWSAFDSRYRGKPLTVREVKYACGDWKAWGQR